LAAGTAIWFFQKKKFRLAFSNERKCEKINVFIEMPKITEISDYISEEIRKMEKKERLKTSEEYKKALKKLKPNIIKDKLLSNPYDDEDIQKGVNVVAVSYDMALDPKFKEIMTAESPINGKIIHRFNHIPQTKEDLKKKLQLIHILAKETACAQRCVGSDALHTLYVATQQVDKSNKFKTEYHERFKKYLRYIQDNDIAPAAAVTDAKGDRSLPPSQQPEKSSYVYVEKETDEGIYVSGIKTPITMSLYAEELIVLPGLMYGESDKDCAVAFAVPADAEGVERYVLGPDVTTLCGEFCCSHGRKYLNKEGMVVFNNVFVPKDRIFLNGEYSFAATFANLFATLHRFSYCSCKPAIYDIMTGAAMLISEYNGTKGEYFLSNTSEKIFEIYKNSIMVRGMGMAAVDSAEMTESGAILPDQVFANMGKFLSSEHFHKSIAILQDMAGSLPTNLPYPELLSDEKFKKSMKVLFSRKKGISPEDHYRLNEFIRTLVASNESGLLQFGSKHGGGNKEAEKVAIYGNSLRRMSQCKKHVKKMIDYSH
jgi:4-hydroxyphenylacetate 3-monooxygenase/4-hydroxybutyryl-CoA dehydratase/vinylacetyl-CoA-Delta-isomerase